MLLRQLLTECVFTFVPFETRFLLPSSVTRGGQAGDTILEIGEAQPVGAPEAYKKSAAVRLAVSERRHRPSALQQQLKLSVCRPIRLVVTESFFFLFCAEKKRRNNHYDRH